LPSCLSFISPIDSCTSIGSDLVLLVSQDCGPNLADFLQQNGSYDPGETETAQTEVLMDLLSALNFLQNKGLAHRDISLQNVCTRDGRACLINLELIGFVGEDYEGMFEQMGY
jgi:serine/threonine protein kinase